MNASPALPTPAIAEQIAALRMEAERIEEDAAYSSTGHFEASKPWGSLNYWLGLPITVLAVASGVTSQQEKAAWATGLAFGAAAGAALMTFLRPQEKQKLHAECGNAYAALRNDARIFHRIDCASSRPLDELRAQFDTLAQRRNSLNTGSPIIPQRAFRRAQRSIAAGEKTHRIDANR